MESTRLSHILENTYIPPQKMVSMKSIPSYHPCLIGQDCQTDFGKLKECGCADNYCVREAGERIPRAR